jgi:hypothetical protein
VELLLCGGAVTVAPWLHVVFYERIRRWQPPWPSVPASQSRAAFVGVAVEIMAILATLAFMVVLLVAIFS